MKDKNATNKEKALMLLDFPPNELPGDQLKDFSIIYYSNIRSSVEMLNYNPEEHFGIDSLIKINFSEYFHKNESKTKSELLAFLYNFENDRLFPDGRCIKEWFGIHKYNVSLWWLSDISEKSTLKTVFFKNLVFIQTVNNIIQEKKLDAIIVTLEDRVILEILRTVCANSNIELIDLSGHKRVAFNKSIIGEIRKLTNKILNSLITLCAWIKAKMLVGRMCGSLLEQSQTISVSYFPSIDKEEAEKGRFINKYIEPLHRYLLTKDSMITTICIPAKIGGTRFTDHIAMIRKFKRSHEQGVVLIHELFSFLDWLRLIGLFVRISYKYRQIKTMIKSNMIFNFNDKSINIWPIVEGDFDNSFSGTRLINNLVYMLSFYNLSKKVNINATVFYLCEMQGWEKALTANLNREGIKSVGYQHASVPLMFLHYFYHPHQLSGGKNGINELPIPTVLATVGEKTRKIFIESGWPSSRVVAAGAYRFEHFKQLAASGTDWSQRDNVVIAATNIEVDDTRRLITYLIVAFKDFEGIKVILKPHPALPAVTGILSAMSLGDDGLPFTISNTSLDVLMQTAKCMIITDSTSGFESIAQGCPVIAVRFPDALDRSPFTGISDIPYLADDPESLRNITREIMEKKQSPISSGAGGALIKSYFHIMEDDFDYGIRFEDIKRNLTD